MAERIGRGVFTVTKSVASRIDETSTNYSSRNAVTNSPIVVSQNTKDGIETFARGSAAVARISKVARFRLETSRVGWRKDGGEFGE